MTKGKLIKNIAKKTGYSRDACAFVVDTFLEEFAGALIEGERLLFKDLMAFEVIERGPQRRRNPTTGEVDVYPPHKTVHCKISKSLKDAVNGR